MSKNQIKRIITDRTTTDGLTETGVTGVQLFRAAHAIGCVPSVNNPCVVTEIALEMENALGVRTTASGALREPGIRLARWDDDFNEALLRFLKLGDNEADTSVLADAPLFRIFRLYGTRDHTSYAK